MKNIIEKLSNIPGGTRYPAMEGLRAYAIILTFGVHYFTYVFDTLYRVNVNKHSILTIHDLTSSYFDSLMMYFFRSHYAVDLFFILSGFLIFRLLSRGSGNIFEYVSNRIYRIYPVFLFSLVFAIWAKGFLIPHRPTGIEYYFKSVFLYYINYNYPAWSLRYELIFYMLAPFVIFIIKRCSSNINSYRVILIALFMTFALLTPFPRFAMFFSGMLIATISDDELKRYACSFSDWPVLILFMLPNFVYSMYPDLSRMVPVFGISLSVFFVKSIYGNGFLNFIFSTLPMRILGNISYSFYMIHGPSLTVGYWFGTRIAKPEGMLSMALVVLAVSLVVTLALSVVMFLLLELPYFKYRENKKQEMKARLKMA